MAEEPIITLSRVSKKYTLHHQKPTLVETVFHWKKEEFWALRNVDLKINAREKIGIVGPNGSGKSTLLKVVAGITEPTKGKVKTRGRIASLIDLKAGFHPDLTGEENLLINGLLLGMSAKELKEKFRSIIRFAEIGKFIDSPLHTYSNGMMLRLGLAVAVHSNPDILIIDEVLGVGDEKFKEKSYQKILSLQKSGTTMLYVSHHLPSIEEICDYCYYLKKGKVVAEGKPHQVVEQYKKDA